ncbi:hypothetical protein BDB00DRAFT_843256 [Zychaea mexicana]|uniref:uncharacterized protein n=1 Tax=Zychaea mexicana TaxID=64656 RepID=UPI0022FE8727|nr:uncharacterized protein BDB00DRAFT_843256 [Zychaea mexicana]KAI9489404.1 hypothetical protein BDB00DRAFT_843256 [Zychaea mexicana]
MVIGHQLSLSLFLSLFSRACQRLLWYVGCARLALYQGCYLFFGPVKKAYIPFLRAALLNEDLLLLYCSVI